MPGSANTIAPAPRANILKIDPYNPGESGRDGSLAIKLSSNENPAGPSAKAIKAFRRSADSLGIYPDGDARDLREAIASVQQIAASQIICGAGSDELIGLLCQVFAGPGDEIIHTDHAFSMYRISALAAGATPVNVPERALTADVDAILAHVNTKTKIVFLANPNNPTGTYLPEAELRRMADGLPQNVLLAVDEAYAEYMREPDYLTALRLVEERQNIVTTRTFSKIYGLAAARLGWLYGPEAIIGALHCARSPFNVSAPAMAAGTAAVLDASFVERCVIDNEVWRDWLTKKLNSLGTPTMPSFANFVLPEFGVEGARSAATADSFLRAKNIYVRRMDSYGLPGHLRVTVGDANQNIALINALTEFFDAVSKK